MHLAIDLGAGSGRAMLGRLDGSSVLVREVHRFTYPPRHQDAHLRWPFALIADGISTGIRAARDAAAALGTPVESVGVDSWGVDYGLVDDEGVLIEDPICYRDDRTKGLVDDVCARVPRSEIFSRTGIQFLSLNTLYQLVAHVREGLPARAARLLLIPDLCHHELCGSQVTERTNASTTQLMDVSTASWDAPLLERLGLPRSLMPGIIDAGTELGTVNGLRVIAPATHDTGSAVAGTPLTPGWAYISSGTWSLVGVERREPLVSEAALRANFTNEAGAGGTTRFLKNVMGLWILEACRREWDTAGRPLDYARLLEQVAALNGMAGLVCPDDPRFFNPQSMTGALRSALEASRQSVPDDPILLTKVILDSLALRYASVLNTIEALTGSHLPGIHIVGGGSLNDYLNQATADASGREVLAGPVEATAVGNLIVQAIACGRIASIEQGRQLLRQAMPLRRFTPRDTASWAEAARRYRDIEGQCAA